MIQRAAQTENHFEAFVLARSCAVARKSAVDPARVVQWANQAVAGAQPGWYFHALGLAHYRAGQFDEALQSFAKANVETWGYRELNSFGLALVHHRLGDADEAWRCFDKGVQWLEREGPLSPEQPAKLFPQDWLEAQLLRREAEELLKPDEARSHFYRGLRHGRQEKWPEAEAEYRQAIRLRPEWYEAQYQLAITVWEQGPQKDAEAVFREALRLEPDLTLTGMSKLALGYQAAGKLDKAQPLFEETLKLRKAKLGPDHLDTLENMNNLAVGYWWQKRPDQSIPLFETLLKLREKQQGRQHLDTLTTVAHLGMNYKDASRLKEAIPLLEEAYQAAEKYSKLHSVVHPLADAYAKAGQTAKLTQLLEQHLTLARKALPKDGPQLAGELALIGLALLGQKKWSEADPLLRECLAIREKTQPDAWTTFNAQSLLGGALMGQKKYAEAEPLLLKGYAGMKQREKMIHPLGTVRLPEAIDRLIELYTVTNRPDETKKWQAERAKYPSAKK